MYNDRWLRGPALKRGRQVVFNFGVVQPGASQAVSVDFSEVCRLGYVFEGGPPCICVAGDEKAFTICSLMIGAQEQLGLQTGSSRVIGSQEQVALHPGFPVSAFVRFMLEGVFDLPAISRGMSVHMVVHNDTFAAASLCVAFVPLEVGS